MTEAEREEAQEAFAAWRGHPVTKQVMHALETMSSVCKDRWMALSWGEGKAEPDMLADLRARSEAFSDVVELDFEGLEAALEQPERD
jgi:hypothetical protein